MEHSPDRGRGDSKDTLWRRDPRLSFAASSIDLTVSGAAAVGGVGHAR